MPRRGRDQCFLCAGKVAKKATPTPRRDPREYNARLHVCLARFSRLNFEVMDTQVLVGGKWRPFSLTFHLCHTCGPEGPDTPAMSPSKRDKLRLLALNPIPCSNSKSPPNKRPRVEEETMRAVKSRPAYTAAAPPAIVLPGEEGAEEGDKSATDEVVSPWEALLASIRRIAAQVGHNAATQVEASPSPCNAPPPESEFHFPAALNPPSAEARADWSAVF